MAENLELSGTSNNNVQEDESSSLSNDEGSEVNGEQENSDNTTASSRFKVRSLFPGSTFSHQDL